MEQQVSEQAQPRRRVRRSAEQWASLIAAQAGSGLSNAAFCRARGLTVSSFHAWRRWLRRGGEGPSPARGFVRLWADDGGGGGDDNPPRGSRPVVVRFADAVEVHVEGGRLGEVLTRLRDGESS